MQRFALLIIPKKGAIFFSLRKKDYDTAMLYCVIYRFNLFNSFIFLENFVLFTNFVGYVIYF